MTLFVIPLNHVHVMLKEHVHVQNDLMGINVMNVNLVILT